jgi:hypothetical protein
VSFDYRQWWRESGGAVRKKRRKRYKTDPEHRDKQRQWSADWRKKNKKTRDKRFKQRRRRKPVVVRMRSLGVVAEFVCWSVGTLAHEVGRTKQFIDSLVSRGQFPETPLQSSDGTRYYTQQMIDGVKRVFESRSRIHKKDDMLYFEILWWWSVDGVPETGRVLRVNSAEHIPLDGTDETLCSVEAVAAATGRSVNTISNWQRSKFLPRTPFVVGGRTYYPEAFIRKLCRQLGDARSVRGREGLRASVQICWTEELTRLGGLGVVPATPQGD